MVKCRAVWHAEESHEDSFSPLYFNEAMFSGQIIFSGSPRYR